MKCTGNPSPAYSSKTRAGDNLFTNSLIAVTGKVAWQHDFGTGQGFMSTLGSELLATAGGILFGADQGKNFVAFDSERGTPLWHSRLQNVSNAPEAFMLDHHQYVMVAADDMIYAFTLY
jgi:glucose dehydrogenase